MDNNEIRELAAIMRDMGLTSLEYQRNGESVKMARQTACAPDTVCDTAPSPAEQPGEDVRTGSIFTVKSPMVGVFYSAPGPDDRPYVAVGDTVLAGDVLCVIEAMKIMNEITAERDGTITEIFVENKQVVEYGQPLFRIGAVDPVGDY